MVALNVSQKGLSLSIEKTKEAFDLYAKLVAKKGVRVVFRGTQAGLHPGGLIVLPELSLFQHPHMTADDVEKAQKFLQAVRGFALHEIGHVLFTSEGDVRHLKDLARHAWNLVEDVWMEDKLCKAFGGGRDALYGTHEWLRAGVVEQFDGWSELKRAQKLGGLLLAFGWTGRTGFDGDFFKSLPPEVQALTRELTPELKRVTKCQNSRDCVKLSQEVLEKAKRLIEEEEEKKEEAGDEQEEQEGKNAESEEKASGPGEDDEDAEEDDGGDDEDDDKDGGASDEKKEGAPEEWSEEEERAASQVLEDAKDEKAFTKAASKEADKAKREPRTYRVYSTLQDTVQAPPRPASRYDFEQVKRRVGQTANVIRNRLAARLRAQSNDYTLQGLDEGEFDASAAYRVIGGASDVYREDITEQSLRATGVLLLVNESGSMDFAQANMGAAMKVAGRMSLAQQTALLFGEVLTALGIRFAVFGHTTDLGDVTNANAREVPMEDRRLYSIYGATRLKTIKGFDENFNVTKFRIPLLRATGCTHDAQVLRTAGKLICQQRLSRRIILTIDDGHPHHVPVHTTRGLSIVPAPHEGPEVIELNAREVNVAVAELTRAGVECVGIGMQSDSVSKYYKKHVVINQLSDFNQQALKTLGDLLLK